MDNDVYFVKKQNKTKLLRGYYDYYISLFQYFNIDSVTPWG